VSRFVRTLCMANADPELCIYMATLFIPPSPYSVVSRSISGTLPADMHAPALAPQTLWAN